MTGCFRKNLTAVIGTVVLIFTMCGSVAGESSDGASFNRRYHTPAHVILDMERALGSEESDYLMLDSIIDEAARRISHDRSGQNPDPVVVLRAIDDTLDDLGFSYGMPELFHDGLRDRKLDCFHYTVTYVSIGKALNLPLYGVSAPEHAFVRWDADGRHDPINPDNPVNKGDVNWEATDPLVFTDAECEWDYNINPSSLMNGVFLYNLTYDELISSAHNNIAIYHELNGDYSAALNHYDRALEMYPKDPLLYCNRGGWYYSEGDLMYALQDLSTAIWLDPNDSVAYYLRGLVLFDMEKYEEAFLDFDYAVTLYPFDPSYWFYKLFSRLRCVTDRLFDLPVENGPLTQIMHEPIR
ncbi:MAG: tetratricopeptide repeat protein [Deltaproteobacteria bacterium]|nr:tetratricopeptide repeat protein [Candidatus Zymogenaceae bacterium]